MIDYVCRHHPELILQFLVQHGINGIVFEIHDVIVELDVKSIGQEREL